MTRQRVIAQSIIYALLVTFVVNAHGIARLTVWPSVKAGQLNFLLAPLLLGVMASVVVLQVGSKRFRIKEHHASLLGLTILLSTVLFVFGIGLLPYGKGVSLPQLVRDLGFLWMITVTAIAFNIKIESRSIDLSLFTQVLFFLSVIILPIVGAFTFTSPLEGRYGGFLLTSSMMGNAVFLLLLIAYEAKVRRAWLLVFTAVSGVIIFSTGTRVAFVLYVGFVLYYFGYQWVRWGRKGFRAVTLALVGLVAIFVVDGIIAYLTQVSQEGTYRVISVSDVEAGSIATRLLWLQQLWSEMPQSLFLGGFGAGQAELFIGVIPHFDVLRYWFDYSIIYVIIFAILIIKISRIRKQSNIMPKRRRIYSLFVYVSVFAMTTHNIFQDVAITLLAVLMLIPGVRKIS